MARLLKILAGAAGVVVVLLLAVGAWFKFFFDPNDLRQTIATQVEQQTGRSLSIEGDLELSVFPWLGMSIGRTSLSEDPAFGEGSFVSFDSASARVKVLPLLSKRIEIGKVSLKDLDVRLIRNKQGVDNFASLLSQVEAAPAETVETSDGGTSMELGQIGGLEVLNASFTLDDRQTGQLVKLTELDATTGPIGMDDAQIAIDTSFEVSVNEPSLNARVALSGDGRRDGETLRFSNPRLTVSGQRQELSEDLTVDAFTLTVSAPAMTANEKAINMPSPNIALEAQGGALDTLELQFEADALEMLLEGDKLSLPKPSMRLSVSGDIVPAPVDATFSAAALTVAPSAETLSLSNYELDAMGVRASGSLAASNWSDALRASGPLSVAPFSLRDLMARLDIPLETADPDAMSRVSLQGEVAMSGNAARLTDMTMKLDDTTITGRAGLSDLAAQVLDFNLNIDAINADGYLAPTAAPAEGQGSAADAVVLDPETLRAFNASGKVNIGRFTFSGIESTDVQIGLSADGGQIRVFPSKANLYGGTYSGDIRVDATGARPTLSLNETVSGIDFNAFAAAVVPDVPIHGTLSGNVLMNGSGVTTSEIKSTLNGTTGFDFTDGYVAGIDLWHAVQSILALADKEAPPAGTTPRRTQFEQLKGSARVDEGVVTIENMIVAVEHLDVTGGGTVDLNDSVINVQVQAQIVEEEGKELLARERNLLGFKVPVYVGGTIEAPSISPTKSVTSVVAQLAKRKLAGRLGLLGDDEGEGTSQGDVDTAVDEKKEELKDKIDDKAKDLLKDLFKKKQ